jgi:hypothetical protein
MFITPSFEAPVRFVFFSGADIDRSATAESTFDISSDMADLASWREI